MKSFYTLLCVLGSALLSGFSVAAQDAWPKTVTTSQGAVIKLYQWQPESYSGNNLKAKAAISVLESGKTDPVFGMAWLKATTNNNGGRVQIQQAEIENIKLPGDDNNLDSYADALEQYINQGGVTFAQSDLQTSLDLNNQQTQLSQQISNTPPKVLYSNTPSILVLIDGAPQLQRNSEWGVDAVVNTPFTIIKNSDGRFYLYGGKHWYTASSATGPYAMTTQVSQNLNSIAQQVNDASKDNGTEKETDENVMYKIVVSTEPAELIQSKGEANFAPVSGTDLLYVSNSEDDIFMDVQSQQYYVLISGRWYKSKTLSGQWQFVASDKLPQDFASIEEGSPKDNVLASVAGTAASQDALADAEVPQTAKVDRQQAKADVVYDGDPQFEDIDGTEMDYAVNTSASVIRWRGRYYSVDNGIWFESNSAVGPWSVAVVRPSAVALIPPRYPVYNMKYVYIYDVTPDYVWMGYTPGYLNTFAYGPTIVYGTGYYYRPWFRHYYFPRPYTWGFGIRYNPWIGWGFGFNYNAGWFHSSIGFGSPWGYGYGGWWGPRVYRPSYCYTPYRSRGGYYGGGYYSNGYRSRTNINIVQINRTNNIYNYRGGRGVVTRDNQRVAINNRGRDFNRQGYANRNYNNNNGNRSGRFDNNNRGGNNNNGNRTYNRQPNDQRDNRFGNNRPSNRDNNNNNGSQRPNRQWRSGDNRGNGDGNRTPGAITTPGSRERTIRDNNNRQRDDNNRWNNRNNNPAPGGNREPRVNQPRGNDDNRQWQNRGSDRNPGNSGGGRVIQPQQPQQPRQQREAAPAAPQQRSFERSRDNGGGGNRGGDQGGGRPSRGGGNGGGGSERPGRRG